MHMVETLPDELCYLIMLIFLGLSRNQSVCMFASCYTDGIKRDSDLGESTSPRL